MKKNNIVNVLILTLSMSALIFGGLFFITSGAFNPNTDNQTFVNVLDNTSGNKFPAYSGKSSNDARENASGSSIHFNTINPFGHAAVVAQPSGSVSSDFGAGDIISPHKNNNVQSSNAGEISSLLAMQAAGSARQQSSAGYSSVGIGIPSTNSQNNTVSKQDGLTNNGGVSLLDDAGEWDENTFLGIDPTAPVGEALGFLFILAVFYAVRMRRLV